MKRKLGLVILLLCSLTPQLAGAQESTVIYREDFLYDYDRTSGKWVPITHPEKLGLFTLYGRWDNELYDFVWVTKDNRDRIVGGTKVEGWRLGYTGKNYLNWFRYCPTCEYKWKKSTDHVRPAVYRYSAKLAAAGSTSNGIYRSEQANETWATFGGEVDPLPKPRPEEPPPVKPHLPIEPPPLSPPPVAVPPPLPLPPKGDLGCSIQASPGVAKVNEAILVTMTTWGPAVSAELDGAAVDFPKVIRTLNFEKAGTFTIQGQVFGRPPLAAQCAATIKVTR